MIRRAVLAVMLTIATVHAKPQTIATDEAGVREFIARWNDAYTSLDSRRLASLETADFELIDRFGHWVTTEGPEFNERLWALTFRDIYHGKPGPARQIESIRFLAENVAIVEARANHPDGVTLDDGTRIPPFWEINTYTLVKTDAGWRVSLLNIHNQINPGTEGVGQHVPDASATGRRTNER